jgi:hypothetical protein
MICPAEAYKAYKTDNHAGENTPRTWAPEAPTGGRYLANRSEGGFEFHIKNIT